MRVFTYVDSSKHRDYIRILNRQSLDDVLIALQTESVDTLLNLLAVNLATPAVDALIRARIAELQEEKSNA